MSDDQKVQEVLSKLDGKKVYRARYMCTTSETVLAKSEDEAIDLASEQLNKRNSASDFDFDFVDIEEVMDPLDECPWLFEEDENV